MPDRRPNILLILSDQEQHWSAVPGALERPGLQWLLDHGTGFAGHHVVTLACGPSRSTIYTGQHTAHTGVLTNPSAARPGMSAAVPTIGGLLRENGYYTAYKGKWHVSVIDPPTRFAASTVDALEEFGFAEYTSDGDPVGIPWDGYRQDPAIASDAANWLLGRSGGKPADAPWFLAVNFVNPHDVMFFDATGQMDRTRSDRLPVPRLPAPAAPLYTREWDLPLPASFGDDLRAKPSSQALQAGMIETMLGTMPRTDEPAWRALRSYYYNCLVDLDRSLATLLQALVASGHDRDTVVVYTSDHGEAAGAHGLREKPTSVYREVVNVPLVIAHPDRDGSATTAALSSAIDLAPTLLGFAGIDQPTRTERYPALRGHDLGPVIGGATGRSGRDDAGVLFCMDRPPAQVAGPDGRPPRASMHGIYDGRWKFARYFAAGETGDGEHELYDTASDPDEVHNLAADAQHEARIHDMARRLDVLAAQEVGAPARAAQRDAPVVAAERARDAPMT